VVVTRAGPGALCGDRVIPADAFLEISLTRKEEMCQSQQLKSGPSGLLCGKKVFTSFSISSNTVFKREV